MDYRVVDIVRRHARSRGDQPALIAADARVTWAELDARANRVGQALRAMEVGPGDRIAHLDKNSIAYFELLFGAGKVGAVLVDVNWRLVAREVGEIVDDAQAKLLVAGEEFRTVAEQVASARELPLIVGGAAYESWIADQPADDPGREPAEDEIALQLYTSGTTGLPKGVMLTHANMGTLAEAVTDLWKLDSESVSLVAMPLFHIGGSGWALAGLNQGCRCVLVREVMPDQLLDTMERERVTNAFLVPAVLQFLCAVPGAAERDWSAFRSIAYGASPITNEALKRSLATFGCDLIQVYGLTETTGAITELPAADHDPDGPRAYLMRSAGRPYPWVEMKITDPSTGDVLPPGEVGEVWTRSPQNMAGYWHKPEETAATLAADGWLRTGDAGYLDAEGYLYLTDRVKDMIVSGGENVYPAEVANVLADHPDIAEVAVIGVPDERFGEGVHAVVVPRAGASMDADALVEWARDRLAGFKRPRSVSFVDALPRNPSGKILKRELRAPYWEGRERQIG